MEKAGQTHTSICQGCGVTLLAGQNWTYSRVLKNDRICKNCKAKHNREHEKTRMFVDGKYIKVSHPLYKAGKYKSFEHAAFESLGNYKGIVEGQVYILYSPAYPSWCKIGMAVDARDRLSNFQTGTPYRDYILVASYDVPDRREAEKEAHKLLRETHASKNEWFVVGANVAKEILDGHFNEDN